MTTRVTPRSGQRPAVARRSWQADAIDRLEPTVAGLSGLAGPPTTAAALDLLRRAEP